MLDVYHILRATGCGFHFDEGRDGDEANRNGAERFDQGARVLVVERKRLAHEQVDRRFAVRFAPELEDLANRLNLERGAPPRAGRVDP